jgi:hypothetical protein
MDKPRMYGRGPLMLHKEDPTRCIEEVYDDFSRASFQCRNRRKEGPGLKYCGKHNPDKIAARDAARHKAYEEKRRKRWDVILREEHKQMTEELARVMGVLRQIAETGTDDEAAAGGDGGYPDATSLILLARKALVKKP